MENNTNKLRVVVFSEIPTHPQDMGCRRRVFNLLSEFQNQNCEIFFIYNLLWERKLEAQWVSLMRDKWDRVYVYENKFIPNISQITLARIGNMFFRSLDKNAGRIGRIIKRIFPTGYSHIKPASRKIQKLTRHKIIPKKYLRENHLDTNADFRYDKEIFDFVKQKIKDINPDIFICEYSWWSFVLDAADDNVLKLIDTHDSFTEFAKKYISTLDVNPNFVVTEAMEKKLLQRSDISIAIQDTEKKYFEKLTGKGSSITIGHILDIKKNSARNERKNLLFVGSDWMPNTEGIKWFLENSWPKIKEMYPKANLTIVGGVTKHLGHYKGINLIPFVENIEDEYEKADVVICPIRSGSGLKIKAVEAISHGRPIVATSHVAVGFGKYNNENSLFKPADNADDFSSRVVELLENLQEYAKKQNEGWQFCIKYNFEQKKQVTRLIKTAKKKNSGKILDVELSKKYDAAMFIQLNNTCNLNCKYCISRDRKKISPAIDLVKFERFVMGLDRTFLFIYEGDGEPTLHPQVVEISKIITKHKHFIAITSNMTTDAVLRIAEQIDPDYIDYVLASAHTEELEKKGLIKKYFANCNAFKRRGVPVTCMEVGFPPLISQVPRIKSIFAENGFDLKFDHFRGIYGNKNYPVDYSKEELEAFGLDKKVDEKFKVFGKYCNAGYNFFGCELVDGGNIVKCRPAGQVAGNIWRRNFNIQKEPSVCLKQYCPNPYKFCNPYLNNKMAERLGKRDANKKAGYLKIIRQAIRNSFDEKSNEK